MRAAARLIATVGLALLGCAPSMAANLSIDIVDRQGQPVPDTVVTVTPAAAGAVPVQTAASSVMDQRNLAFVPLVLAVAVGSSVVFPNNDSVSHQVYSFSAPKKFQLPLYKGKIHPPVTFDRPGLVVLGCNIHDSMVGYIFVTDAPFFGTTDVRGILELKDLPDGEYRVSIWNPFITDPPESLNRSVRVDMHQPATRIRLARDLRSQPEPRPKRSDWEY
jgi:plastocyanin